jgi:hypothetical protein
VTSQKTHEEIRIDKTRSSYLFFKEFQNYPSHNSVILEKCCCRILVTTWNLVLNWKSIVSRLFTNSQCYKQLWGWLKRIIIFLWRIIGEDREKKNKKISSLGVKEYQELYFQHKRVFFDSFSPIDSCELQNLMRKIVAIIFSVL